MLRRALNWLFWRVALMGLYLALAAKTHPSYIVMAAALSLLAPQAVVWLIRLGLANPEGRLG